MCVPVCPQRTICALANEIFSFEYGLRRSMNWYIRWLSVPDRKMGVRPWNGWPGIPS